MTKRAEELIERYRYAKSRRSLWNTLWEDLARVQLPRRLGFITDVEEGERRTEELYDGTPMREAKGLANKLGGMMRPEGEQWFHVKTVDDQDSRTDEAKEWLLDVEERMMAAFNNPKAAFRQASGEVDLDLVVFGTGILGVTEAVGENHMLYESVWLRDGVPSFGERGMVEAMFRTRKLTIRQAMRKWGRFALSEPVQSRIDSGQEQALDEKIEFLFAVVPREDARSEAVLARNLPIADIVIEIESLHEVAVGGFHEMPYIVPRFDTSSGEEYGRSPGMYALPDSNTSQAIGETMLMAGQRAADPPIASPSDAFLDYPHVYPGGVVGYEMEAVKDASGGPRTAIFALEPGHNFPLTREIQQDTREQIGFAFLRHLFNLPHPGDATMTATEVLARLEEFIREGGPIFGRLETNYTAPTVERSFQVQLRAGAFLPIPEVLQGRGVRFEYESPVKRIRERAQAVAADAHVQIHINAAAETQKPEILDNIDFDEWSRFRAKATSIPHSIARSEEEIAALREQRAEEQQAAAELAQAQQMAAIGKDAGAAVKSVADTGQAA